MAVKPTYEELEQQIALLENELVQRKRSEEKLKDSEAKYRSESNLMRLMCDSVPDMIWAKDHEKRYIFANKALCLHLLNAADTNEPLGKTTMFFTERERLRHANNPEWHTLGEICQNTDTITMDAGTPQQFDEYGNVQGKFLFLEMRKAPFMDQNGKMIGTVGSARDVTTAKEMEQSLNQSEAQMRAITDSARDGILMMDQNGIISYWNPAAERILGYTREEAIDKKLHQLIAPQCRHETHQATLAGFQQTGQGNAIDSILELGAWHKDGHEITAELSLSAVHYQDLWYTIGILRDITERKRAEDALRESEAKHRLLFESANDAIFIHDMQARMLAINTVACERLGYTHSELMSLTVNQVNPPEESQNVRERITRLMELGHLIFETKHVSKDGSFVPTEVSSRRITWDGQPAIMSICRNITERKRAQMEKDKLQSQLQQALKMEAIGSLAGGIAHDFNNLLMGIQGRATLISWDLDVSHPHREHIHAIEEQIRSASSLTQQLLGFARGGKYEVNPVDMNELVHSSSAMFGRTKKEIRIHTKYHASPLVVDVDRGQIEQVLLNMYINAWQAMPPDGGELFLETKIVTLDDAFFKPHQTAPGRYVMVSITDTGAGMNEATRLQIFDPFFTTKEKGRGTGMGLASAYGIIKNHGGMITVYSEVGHGTTFNIYLPVSDKEAHREVPLEEGLIKGSATILLVDDEELIIDVGQAMLARLGYRVMVCRGGQEAVNVITDIGNIIDMVILDMIMPGMDGGTTFNRIREIQPDMPVLLSSGYAMNGHAEKIMRRGCNGFIQKPYNISELSQKIRKVLDESIGSTQ